MKYIFVILVTLSLYSCQEDAQENDKNSKSAAVSRNTDNGVTEEINSPCHQMDSVLSLMDSLKAADYSMENDELIWQYSEQVNELAYECSGYLLETRNYQPENFNLCWSSDSVLGIISWDTRMGGTFVNVEHIKFAKTQDSNIYYKSTDREKKGDGDINATSYSQIAKLPIEGKEAYICRGAGKTSNPTFYYTLDIVEISSTIRPLSIFPEDLSSISVDYDMMEIYGDMEVLDFIVLPNGNIQIPEMKGYSTPTGNYITWKLKEDIYQVEQPYEIFIPQGYEVLEMEEGHIYQDGLEKNDIVLILRDTMELNDEYNGIDAPRPLIVLRATKDGYELAARADNVVMCQDCGGVFGDPFDYLAIGIETIEIGHYGGSSQRWYERYTFQLDEGGNEWELSQILSGGHSVFDEDGDREIDEYEEIIETKENFGTILMKDFGKE